MKVAQRPTEIGSSSQSAEASYSRAAGIA